jgi:hypothetical protein
MAPCCSPRSLQQSPLLWWWGSWAHLREIMVHTQEKLVQVCTPAAPHDVIGQLFPLSAWGFVQDKSDQAVVRGAVRGARALEAPVSLSPQREVQIIGPCIRHTDSCIMSAFKACIPRYMRWRATAILHP